MDSQLVCSCSSLSATVAETREELDKMKTENAERRSGRDGSSRENRRPRPWGTADNLDGNPRPAPSEAKEESYWLARRQLRLWPVTNVGSSLEDGVVAFLREKLLISQDKIDELDFRVRRVDSRPDAVAKDQVVVTFGTARERDSVKAKASNLRGGDKQTGCQLEPPDFLRGQYQAFQGLAYCLKKKTPGLKRNIKFDDLTLSLKMDIKTDDSWRTVEYVTAKSILKVKSSGTAAVSRTDLKKILNNSDLISDSDESMDDDNVNPGQNLNNKQTDSYPHTVSFLNANARSLGPKLQSLGDSFSEKLLDIATVTETWLQSGVGVGELVAEMEGRFSLGLITRQRQEIAPNGRQYGGVAFVYRLKTAKFEEFPLHNPENYEILATVGKVTGVKGKFFCLSCYAPPNLTQVRAQGLIEYASDLVCEAKRTYKDCSVIVTGDFNQWAIEEIVEDHPDLKEIPFGPTRGDRAIDRTFTNFGRSIVEYDILPPLETEEGSASDHNMTFARATFTPVKQEKITYSYRPYTHEGAARFVRMVAAQDWSGVMVREGVNEKADYFQSVLDGFMGSCFPMKTTTRRESDDPWINDAFRKLAAKKRRVYHKEGRSKRWRALNKKSDDMYRSRASNYIQGQKENLTGPDAARNFYKNVRAYKSKEKPPEFNVKDLYPGEKDEAVAEKLAEHFNKISKEFQGINPDQIPRTYSSPIPVLSSARVEAALIKFRKPKSRVAGDIFPSLVNRVAPWIASPLANIYNTISRDHCWPTDWKTEFVTPIPKKPMPETPDDLRNISCTQFFSKVYESFCLAWLTDQANVRSNQYGGVKGLSTEHFLVRLWQRTLENLDDSRAGSLITSIDYSKAFNRLDFGCCLKALKEKGVSQELLNIIASFLSGRCMKVKVGNVFSRPRTVEGGVPQGSLLGVLLFNMTIDSFEAFSDDVESYGTRPVDVLGPVDQAAYPPKAPVMPPVLERDYKHKPIFREVPLQVLKYVDDNIINELLNFDKLQTDGHWNREYHATRTQNLFQEIVVRAEFCGMKVNAAKTHALLVSELKSYNPTAFFLDAAGARIDTKETMKILGLQFSSSPDMSAQVREIRRKFASRMWVLRHLAHRGFTVDDLLKVYTSIILPCHDYCSVVFHSSLTATQSDQLERLQAQALKCIYGYQYSYRELLELTGLSTLKQRREARCLKFALKAVQDPSLADWFPLNQAGGSLETGARMQSPWLKPRGFTTLLSLTSDED